MKKFPKPWFRASRGVWYVTLNGEQHNLGPDQVKAFEKYKVLLNKPTSVRRVTAKSDTIVAVIDKFLEWSREHRAAETYEWYRWRLQLFVDSIDKAMTVADLKHFHIDDWLHGHSTWSNGTKHGMVRAVQRALRWATKKGYIDRSPITDYEKPRPGKRNVVITREQFEELLGFIRHRPFRDLLVVTWETACRPQESLKVEARHVDLANARWVFPADEAKGEQWPRIVYLTDCALEITKRLMKQYPRGPIFRNTHGEPWTPYAVNCTFTALQHRMGRAEIKRRGTEPDEKAVRALIPSLKPTAKINGILRPRTARELEWQARTKLRNKLAKKHAPKYCLYHVRHSWLDRALKRGVDALTAAILMGHRDPSTIAKVYQHLGQSPDYLRDAAKKAAS
jgi:integrase